MSELQPLQDKMENTWKKVFWIISVLILIVMPLVSRDYGQSGDEWIEIQYGQDIYNYFFKGDKQALDYSSKSLQFQGMELYGGFFDYYTQLVAQMMPSVPILIVKHFLNALFGAVMMIFTGLLTFRLSKKWGAAVIALLFIFFSPRIFGESMNNPKDIPHACGFIIGVYGLVALVQDYPRKMWKNALLLALGFGITFGQRPAGGILQACYIFFFLGLYYVLNKDFQALLKADGNKLFKRLALVVAGALLIGWGIGLSSWPLGLQSPISNSMKSLSEMTNREMNMRVLFDGEYLYSMNMPWYYEFKWIFMSNPVVVLLGVVLFAVLILRAIKEYGLFSSIVPVFGALFPLLYMMYKGSTMYDTWRHIFFVYTFWVVAAALGFYLIGSFIKNARIRQYVPVLAFIGLLPAVAWTVRSHPNQYVYFNEFQGGVKGAFGNYDLDYYQNSGKQAADWIIKNVKPIPGRKIMVMSNMLGFDRYFAKDTSWLTTLYCRYGERHHRDWDYYVTYGRYIPAEQLQNGMWPPANVVHNIEVDGAVLSAVIQNKSKAGIAAYEALEKKDFETAAKQYEEYIKTDQTDEGVYFNYGIALANTGRLNEAIGAMNTSIKLDPSRPDVYNILAQLYQATGNMAAAQEAMTTAQSLILREQEKMPEGE